MAHNIGLEFAYEEPPQEDDVSKLTEYVARMFLSLSFQSQEYNYLILPAINVAPERPISGMIVHADGTNWNPGSGQGIYAYYNLSWKKLG